MSSKGPGTPAATAGTFTGRHMAMILVGFFAVVVCVNLAMARLATSTFGGVVVQNSYVASQHFNRWLDAADAGRTLGWKVVAKRLANGRVAIDVAGVDALSLALSGDAWHPLGRLPDQPMIFLPAGEGRFVSTAALPEGRWRLRLTLREGARVFRTQQDIL